MKFGMHGALGLIPTAPKFFFCFFLQMLSHYGTDKYGLYQFGLLELHHGCKTFVENLI